LASTSDGPDRVSPGRRLGEKDVDDGRRDRRLHDHDRGDALDSGREPDLCRHAVRAGPARAGRPPRGGKHVSRRGSNGAWIAVPLLAIGVAAVKVVVLSRADEDASSRRAIGEARILLLSLPTRAEQAIREARERFAQAKVAFREARVSSERALLSQLEEAKQRGSLPPI